MSAISTLLKRQGRQLSAALLLVALLVVPWNSASAQGGSVYGTVALPGGGVPPVGTVVRLLKPDGATFGQANVSGGAFSFASVPNGNYLVRAVPPSLSTYTRSLPQPVSVINAPVNVGTLYLTDPSIVGTVYAPDGATPASAQIRVHSAGHWVQTDGAPGGEIEVGGLYPGTYVLSAWPTTDDPYWASPPQTLTVSSGVSQTISMTLTAADVYGHARDASHNPIPHAVARAHRPDDGSVVGRDETSPSGYFAIGGLRLGAPYVLTLQPPWYEGGLVPPPPITFTVGLTPTDLGMITFGTSPKVVTGTVKANAGTVVENALIEAHRHDKHGRARTLSAADGTYHLRLTEGLWSLTTRPVSTTVPTRWIYPHGPQVVHFQHNTAPEFKTLDFSVLVADSNVTGAVELPGGGVPGFTVAVELRDDRGIGRSQEISPADGSFDMPIPHGRYGVLLHVSDPGYFGPVVGPISVLPGATYALTPAISLLARNAAITGTVTVTGSAAPVADIPMHAWRPGAPGTAGDRTLADGGYLLSVARGIWLVRPAPGPEQPYLYTGPPAEVSVPDGGTVSDVDFALVEADATIVGLLVDENGGPVTGVAGWGHAVDAADPRIQKGAPVDGSQFTVLVPGDSTYNVLLKLPAGTEYVAPAAKGVSVGSGGTTTVTIELRDKNAKIVGALWDRRDQVTVTGVDATVTAFSEGTWLRTAVDPGNGLYTLGVSSGVWTLGYRVAPDSGYVALRHRHNYPVQDHQTVPAPLPVAEKDGTIGGTVFGPDGTGLGGALVVADGTGPALDDVTLKTLSRPDGSFVLPVPYGRYVVRATLGPGSGWINPLSLRAYVPPDGSVTGLELAFLEPDATIVGTVDISGTHSYTGTVHLWAWSPEDGYAKATARLGSGYTLDVISNTTWHVGAAFQTASQYWVVRARVPVPAGGATRDLVLRGPFPLPAPVTVSFDAGDEQYVELADGTSIYVPAGAMPVSGTVTLHVAPIATFSHQRHANIYRYGYAFTASDENGQPIEQRFNQDVLIIFPYDDVELMRMGLSEHWLKPAYFSTTTDTWTFPESYVVDTVANVVAMQIDHFTDFALTGTSTYQVFLPLALK